MTSENVMSPVALIVDDHDAVRRALSEFVQASFSGFRMREAGCVDDAIRIVDAECVGLVIIDIHLPGTNGIDGTRAIRERSPDTRVVVVSKHDDANHRAAASNAGASAYVCKRVINKELIPALENLLHPRDGAILALA